MTLIYLSGTCHSLAVRHISVILNGRDMNPSTRTLERPLHKKKSLNHVGQKYHQMIEKSVSFGMQIGIRDRPAITTVSFCEGKSVDP